MNVLVAGGAGFIGSHLCDALLGLGHRVIALDNFLTGTPANTAHLAANPNFRLIEGDVTAPQTDLDVDAVFHLASAASPEGYGRYPLETLMTNGLGTFHLLELALRTGARFLLASTSEVYGDPTEHPQTETYWGNVNPVGPRSCYDEGKRFAEALTINYHRSRGVDARIVRIFNTYGPRNQPEDGRVIPNFLGQALTGKPLTVYGDGSQSRSFCYVSDLVDGLVRAMYYEQTTGQVINLGNPAEISILELAQVVKRIVKSESEIVSRPSRAEEIVRRRPDITRAGQLLRWKPRVALEDGLLETAAWLRGALAGRGSR